MRDEKDTMGIEDARKIIAAYLSGYNPNNYRFMGDDKLQQALEKIKLDGDYCQYLIEELGIGIDWKNECEVFLSHLAEFSEMSSKERKQKMPDLLAHAETCRSCRSAYWDIKPTWEMRVIEGLKQILRKLTEPISVEVGKTGELSNRGLNPLDKYDRFTQLATAMGEKTVDPILEYEDDDIETKLRREWEFEDVEADYIIHLVVSGQPLVGVAIEFWLTSKESTDLDLEGFSIQLYKYENGSPMDPDFPSEFDVPFFDDSLSALQKRLILNRGFWLIRVRSLDNIWELPLNIKMEGEIRDL